MQQDWEELKFYMGKELVHLNRTVKEILSKHSSVKTFYFAPIEIGGDGITIPELK